MKLNVIILILTLCLIGLCGVATSKNKTISGDDFEIETVGKSGKIAIRAGKKLKKIMTIQPAELVEYADDGITKAGKHFLTNFAKTDFTYSTEMNSTAYNLSATKITFTTTMTDKITGEMTIDMIIFRENGNITVESGEEFQVNKGAVKFNIEIKNWTFCDAGISFCKKGSDDLIGKFLDLTMEIKGTKDGKPEKSKKQKGKKGTSKAKKGSETYDLGDSELIVSHLVKHDGIWRNMTEGFPFVDQKGSKTLFTFRFEKFTNNIYYDPIGQSSDEFKDTDTVVTMPDNNTIAGSLYEVDTLGKSGKITIKSGNPLKRVMTIQADKLEEFTSDGTTKAGRHEIQTFAKTDFTFSAAMDVKMSNLSATKVTFSTTMTDKLTGVMNIEMLVFKENGSITVESGEIFEVNVGSVKFNIDIKNWTFCNVGIDSCKKGQTVQIGEFLDLTMEIKGTKDGKPEKSKKQKGKKGTSKAKTGSETYDMGESELIVSHLVKIDGEWKNMTDNYPKVMQKGSKTLFTFRFPKFANGVYYDPIGTPLQSTFVPPTKAPSSSIRTTVTHWLIIFASLALAYYTN